MVSKTKTQAFFIRKAEEILEILNLPQEVEEYIVKTTGIPRWLYRDLLNDGTRYAVGIRRGIVAVLRSRYGNEDPFGFIPKAC